MFETAGVSRDGASPSRTPSSASRIAPVELPVDQTRLHDVQARPCLRVLRRTPRGRQIPLVGHHEPRTPHRRLEQGAIVLIQRPRSIENDDDRRSYVDRTAGATYSFGLHGVPCRTDTRGVDERHRDAAQIDCLGHQVARGPGLVRHYRPLHTAQLVEET